MPFKKPPIVEMWVEFKFDTPPNQPIALSVQFFQKYANEYPRLEFLREDWLEFKQTSPTKLPDVVGRKVGLKHIRAHDTTGTRWLHLTVDQLVCNFVRLNEQYPGFEAMSKEAVEKLQSYAEICKPNRLQYFAIHYVDVIEIPVPASGEIELKDYFLLGLDLPRKPFGNQISYFVRTALETPGDPGRLEIQLQFESLVKQRNVLRFRMDWHKIRVYHTEVDLDKIF